MSADARRAFSQRVAQCLHFAGLALQRADATAASRREAAEAAVQHLVTAYGAFIGEVLAVSGGVTLADHQGLVPWIKALPQSPAPELARLRAEREQGSLCALLAAWASLMQVEIVRTPKAHEVPSELLIPVHSVPDCITPEQVAVWRGDLSALIDELREGLAEW